MRHLWGLTMLLLACGGGEPAAPEGSLAPPASTADESTTEVTSTSPEPGSDGGGGAAATAAPCARHAFTHDGVRRGYLLCVPDPPPRGPRPVVLGFHGGGGRAAQWQRILPWDETAAEHGFVMVFMQGCRPGERDCSGVDGSYLWSVDKPGEPDTVDDQGYTLAVIDRLRSVHGLAIDEAKIFGTGHSLGGIFLYSMRCDHPDVFAAVGPIAAPPSDGTCSPRGDTSIFHVHGVDDANVPFDSGCCSAAQRAPGNAAYLAACDALPRCFNPSNWWPPVRDGAHPFADVVGLHEVATVALGCSDRQTPVGARPACTSYENCDEGTTVETCLLDGVAHGLAHLDAALDLRAYFWARFASF
ncbi:MAG: hypothetical protein AAGA56_00585 [Myxococcota bacterium]